MKKKWPLPTIILFYFSALVALGVGLFKISIGETLIQALISTVVCFFAAFIGVGLALSGPSH